MGRLPPAPPARRGDGIEALDGERIADPYRWLERDGPATRAWTDAQNSRTRAALDAVPERARFAARLRELLGVGLLGVPRPAGDRTFFDRRSVGQRQSARYVQQGGRGRMVGGPNRLGAGGPRTLDWWS